MMKKTIIKNNEKNSRSYLIIDHTNNTTFYLSGVIDQNYLYTKVPNSIKEGFRICMIVDYWKFIILNNDDQQVKEDIWI